ncbi:MAG: hypothetical protein CSA75_03860 [Sorangium cellulosum]|nr:MAG: hypothetical protein CSA75_03860 [Sorangium cellulosum]
MILTMLTVAVDENADDVVTALKTHTGVASPFEVMLDPDSKVVTDQFGTKAFPETWIIDSDGVIRARFDGARNWAGPLALDMLKNVARGSACPMSIESFVARGPGAKVCRDVAR